MERSEKYDDPTRLNLAEEDLARLQRQHEEEVEERRRIETKIRDDVKALRVLIQRGVWVVFTTLVSLILLLIQSNVTS